MTTQAFDSSIDSSLCQSLSQSRTDTPHLALKTTLAHKARPTRAATMILGHRGARAEILENSHDGLRHACQLPSAGLAGIEFDVQLSADGHLVIFHDDTLERLGRHQARLDQLTLKEIQRIHLGGGPILALDDLVHYQPTPHGLQASLFESMLNFSHIELEVKTHERSHYRAILKALERSLLDSDLGKLPIVLTSFDTTLLACLQRHRQLSHIARGLLTESSAQINTLTNTASQLGCCQVGVHYPLISQTLLQQCQRLDLSVSAWTVNELADARRLIAWGVDALITDYPTLFLQQLYGDQLRKTIVKSPAKASQLAEPLGT